MFTNNKPYSKVLEPINSLKVFLELLLFELFKTFSCRVHENIDWGIALLRKFCKVDFVRFLQSGFRDVWGGFMLEKSFLPLLSILNAYNKITRIYIFNLTA